MTILSKVMNVLSNIDDIEYKEDIEDDPDN